jgi:hypothetical protein
MGEAGPCVEAVLQVAMEQLKAFPDANAQDSVARRKGPARVPHLPVLFS